MVLTFNKAILDNDTWQVVDDRKQIAITYLKTWFIVDLLSCFPFGLFNNIGHGHSEEQIIIIDKVYKLVKLVKLLRIMKIIKN